MPNKLVVLIFFLFSTALQAQQLDHILGEMIVQFHPEIDRPVTVLEQYQSFQGKTTSLQAKKCLSKSLNIWLLSFDFTTIHEGQLLRNLRANKLIHTAQFNHLISKRRIPNDPLFSDQWGFLNTGQNGGRTDADIDLVEAWDITTGGLTVAGDTIVIAILDDGMDLDHEDLKENVWRNHKEIPNNGIDDDNNGYVDDYLGWNVNTDSDAIDNTSSVAASHGTEVSGLIGASGDNNIGISGVNWTIKIMMVSPFGVGTDNEATAIEGYNYVLEARKLYNDTDGKEGAYVVATNSSWGIDGLMPEQAPIWCSFYDFLGQQGIINAVATVNSNINIDEEGDLPTTCRSEYLIGVTSSTKNDLKAVAGYGSISIDLAAPGESVPILLQNDRYKSNGSGTSYSAPLVAGVLGLLYAAPCNNFNSLAKQNPASAALLAKEYILNGVDRKPDFEGITRTGGRLNANNSLELLLADCGACPSILGVNFSAVLENQMTVNWVTDTTINTSIRYREMSTAAWTTLSNLKAPYILANLQACTNYELQFAPECEGEPITFMDSFFSKTEGCCEPPQNIQAAELTTTSIVLQWESIVSASDYEIQWNRVGSGSSNLVTVDSLTYNFTNLEACTMYEFQIRPVCPNKNTVFSAPAIFTTKGCGACTDALYCEAKGNDSFSEWINSVRINDLDIETGSDNGYGDYTSISTTLKTFTSYPISISAGYSGSAFDEFFKVWIDYNQDGQFDDNSEVAYNSEISEIGTSSGLITIPETAILGLTRMRVAMKAAESATSVPPSPCESFTFGEIEDYCINIEEGVFSCLPPNNIEIVTTSNTTATLLWELITGAINLNFRYRVQGETEWLLQNLPASEVYVLPNLQACTNYEFQLRTICGNGGESTYSLIASFTTRCECTAPMELRITDIDSTALRIEWEAVESADTYEIFIAAKDGTTSRFLTVNETDLILDNLPACTDFDFMITSICPSGKGDFQEMTLSTCCGSCITAVEDFPKEIETLSFYPNPFQEQLFVQLTLNEVTPIRLRLYTVQGALLKQQNFASLGIGEQTLDLQYTDWKDGIYLVVVETEKGVLVKRVLRYGNE